jgi:hypothetical protein
VIFPIYHRCISVVSPKFLKPVGGTAGLGSLLLAGLIILSCAGGGSRQRVWGTGVGRCPPAVREGGPGLLRSPTPPASRCVNNITSNLRIILFSCYDNILLLSCFI